MSMLREVVGVFDDEVKLQTAIDELQAHGFNRTHISVLGHSDGYSDVRDTEDDGEMPRTVFVSKSSLGDAEGVMIGIAVYIPAMITAAVLAARGASQQTMVWGVMIAGALGGLLGTIVARLVDQRYARRIHEQLRHGGMVVWVCVRNPEEEHRAMAVLSQASAWDVHAHEWALVNKGIPGWRGISYEMSFMKLLGM